MAELGWLRSSPTVKAPTNGSLSAAGATSTFNGSNENLFDLLQGRLGSSTSGGSIFGPSSSDQNGSPYFGPSDHQEIDEDNDSTSLLKTEDENHLQPTVEQMTMGMQPNLWSGVADTSTSPLLGAIGNHHQGLYNNAHIPSLHPATGMVIDSCQFPSFSSIKPHDPSPQLQALRDFMAYGSNNNINGLGAGHQHHAPTNLAAGVGVPPMFLHLGDESCSPGASSLLQLPGMPGQMQRTYVGENLSPIRSCKPDMLAYRALCQSELFASERSPHRTQFQRENHILAERQRREEMNEKFSALRAMIPKATKKDKASIVGDTIGYVLELEKTLKHLQACRASRKGYFKEFKLLKRKPSLKIATEAAAEDEDCERSMTGTSSTPPDLDQGNPAAVAAAVEVNTPVCALSEDQLSHQHSQQTQCIDIDNFDGPIITSATEKVNGCADPFQLEGKDDEILPSEGVSSSEVDIQNLGEQAVIKIVCARSSGLVLRILLALDECKVDILQSNVTTVAEKSVHFITVQISSGLSSTTEEMIAVLHKASSSPNSPTCKQSSGPPSLIGPWNIQTIKPIASTLWLDRNRYTLNDGHRFFLSPVLNLVSTLAQAVSLMTFPRKKIPSSYGHKKGLSKCICSKVPRTLFVCSHTRSNLRSKQFSEPKGSEKLGNSLSTST